jgi:uncharacterized protein
MINKKVIELLNRESAFYNSSIHGIAHWKTVERNGHYLAKFNSADIKVISYFSYFHDCMRENEGEDDKHGRRGAKFAEKFRSLIDLTDRQFKQLTDACEGHTDCKRAECTTINTCWDADRLDLGRVGISPSAEFLFNQEAKRIAILKDFIVLQGNM